MEGLHKELPVLRKQLIYKSKNMGMKELDIILGNWAADNLPLFSEENCLNYYEEVLQMETPDVLRLLTVKNLTNEENEFLQQTTFLLKIKLKLFE